MPSVAIHLLAGRPPELKAKLARRITDAFKEELGTKPESLTITFHDVEQTDWFTGPDSIAAIRAKQSGS